MLVRRLIFVTTQFEGFHEYAGAPDEVAFLRSLHRHMFHVKVTLEVYHEDREVEFIMLKRWLEARIDHLAFNVGLGFNHIASCESFAEQIYKEIKAQGGLKLTNDSEPIYTRKRYLKIEVNEDLENGSVIEDEF